MQKTCAWLRKEGIDLADTNNQGHNALHKAAYGGHTDLCLWLQDEVRLDPEALIKDARMQWPWHAKRDSRISRSCFCGGGLMPAIPDSILLEADDWF